MKNLLKQLTLSLLFFFTSASLNIYSMEQAETEIQLGRALFSCKTDNPQLLQKLTTQQNPNQRLIIPSLENQNEIALQIGVDGELYVGDLKQFLVKDPDGNVKVTADAMIKSLEEQNIKEKAERLCAGESITMFFSDNSQANVTFDQLIKLVSKIDNSEHKARLSQLTSNHLTSTIMKQNCKKTKKETIKIGLTKQEIQIFLAFLAANKKESSIFQCILLFINPYFHFFPKNFSSYCQHNLVRKIYDSLKKNDFTWLKQISSLPENQRMRAQKVIKEVLNKIIKPVPQNNKREIAKIIDAINTNAFFNAEHIASLGDIKISLGDIKIKVHYKNTQTGNVSFKECNVSLKGLEVKNIHEETIDKMIDLVEQAFPDNISILCTKIYLAYNIYINNKNEVKLAGRTNDHGIDFSTFTPKQLLFTFNLTQNPYHLFKIGIIKAKQILQSFDPKVLRTLKQHYLLDVVLSFLEK